MAGYTPLFASIVRSSIWDEDAKTCKVWVTMLALAEADGTIEASIKGLAHEARVTVTECATALHILKAPDEYSRSKDDEGRRIKDIEGGWLVINHAKYRKKAQSRSAYIRQWRAQKKRNSPVTPKEEEKDSHSYSNTETLCNSAQQSVTHETCFTLEEVKDSCLPNGIPDSEAESYFHHFNAQGWRRANSQAITNLRSHIAKMWDKTNRRWIFDEKQQKSGETKNLPPVTVGPDGKTPYEHAMEQYGP